MSRVSELNINLLEQERFSLNESQSLGNLREASKLTPGCILKVVIYFIIFHIVFFQESGDDEYHGEHSDTEDEVDSDFDIDEGDEPDSDQEEDAPRRKGRVVTKAYKVSDNQELSDF